MMMHRRAIAPIVLLLFLSAPMAYGVTIDGPLNLVGSHGGNVRFDDPTVTNRLRVVNTLWRLSNLEYDGGANRGALAFDCQTGVNMTILAVSRYQVTYLVETAIGTPVTTYVYYANNDNRPVGTNTNTLTFNDATDVTTVTTIGNSVTVTLDYANLSGIGINGLEYFLSLFPIIAFMGALEARKRDIVGNRIVVAALVFALAAIVLMVIRATGA